MGVSVAAPGRHPRGAGAVRLLAQRAAKQAAQHLGAIAQRLSGSALTVAGLACFDVGAFEAHPIAGWITTGVSILTLDWKIDSPGRRPGERQ
jgi:hypothetical protein